jgi:hypothetical protein
MNALAMAESEFETGDWLLRLPDLLALPRRERREANGADQVASFIREKVI